MSVFTDILKAIGIGAGTAKGENKPPAGKTASRQPDISKYTEVKGPGMEEVDVAKKLDGMVKASGRELNWRMSIVDLLTVVGIDSSHKNRVELAKELGISDDLMGGDSAAMNIWLHKQVMKKIAANGGIVPKDLLD